MNLRKSIKSSDKWMYSFLRRIYFLIEEFSIPTPKLITRPLWIIVDNIRGAFYWILSTFWITPLFKGSCHKVGKGFKAGTFLPFIEGRGKISIGKRVLIFGKINFHFGSIADEIPEVIIGDRCTIGHEVTLDISGKLVIGDHCLIASGVTIQDCSGHSLDAEERMANKPPDKRDIRNIKIGNNVWVGQFAYILPGTVIGNDCVIGAKAVVARRIPENHLVYPAPYQKVKIRKIASMYSEKQSNRS